MSRSGTNPQNYKIVVVGASSVGKSSIVQRLVQGTFSDEGATTCGADFYTFSFPVGGDTVKLQIWDTAGQERFRAISKSYFRSAVGAVLVYDITNIVSFDELADWLNDLHSLAAPNAYILLVGNKADLEAQRQVAGDALKEFANRHRLETIDTSALSGKNVKEAFARMAFEVSTRVANGTIAVGPGQPRTVQVVIVEEKRKKDCCG
jgi:small GTP-binding protein